MRNNFRELYKDSNRRSRRSERINVSVQLREDRRKNYLEQRRNDALQVQEVTFDPDIIRRIHTDILSNDRNTVSLAAKNLYQFFIQNQDYSINEYFEFDVIDPLFCLLVEPNSYEDNLCAANTLALLFEREPTFLRKIHSNGHFDKIFNVISAGNPDINEHMFNIIALVSNYMSTLNEQVINHGFIDMACFALSSRCTDKTVSHISYTLSTFSTEQFSKYSSVKEAISKAITMIDFFLQRNEECVVENALRTLSHLTSLSTSKVNIVMNSGILHRAALFLDSPFEATLDLTVLVFGNIVSGDDDNTQKVIDMGVIDKIFQLLNNESEQVRKHVLWSLSNVCAGTVSQVEYIYQRQMFYQIYNHFLHETSTNKREALWIISNILFVGTEIHIRELLNLSVIQHLCEVLRSSVDKESVLVALDSIAFIFERSGLIYEDIVSQLRTYEGDEVIYELCDHPSSKINSLSNEIIQKYLETYDCMEDYNEGDDAQGIDFM